MLKKFKPFWLFLLVIIIALLFTNGFMTIAINYIPLTAGTDLGDLFIGGTIEGFALAYLFFLPIVFIPAFYKQKLYIKLVPLTILGFILMIVPWQAILLSLVVFAVGVLVGMLAVWLRKKL